jgi:ferric iron reductase protein FhuF
MDSIVMYQLKEFDIRLESENSKETLISDLLDEKKCLEFLQKQMLEMKAPNLSVAASMLSKRYAHLVVSSTLYSMVQYNCALKLPLNACALSKERNLYINAGMCKLEEVKGSERELWRENVLYVLFSNHITPFFEILQKTSRVHSSILWENIAIRINSIYRKTLAKELDLVKIERLYSDFNYLKNIGGNLFNLKENPIKHFLKVGEELKLNPFRKTCCMYYKLEEDVEGIGYCGNCPIKSKQKMRNC